MSSIADRILSGTCEHPFPTNLGYPAARIIGQKFNCPRCLRRFEAKASNTPLGYMWSRILEGDPNSLIEPEKFNMERIGALGILLSMRIWASVTSDVALAEIERRLLAMDPSREEVERATRR